MKLSLLSHLGDLTQDRDNEAGNSAVACPLPDLCLSNEVKTPPPLKQLDETTTTSSKPIRFDCNLSNQSQRAPRSDLCSAHGIVWLRMPQGAPFSDSFSALSKRRANGPAGRPFELHLPSLVGSNCELGGPDGHILISGPFRDN